MQEDVGLWKDIVIFQISGNPGGAVEEIRVREIFEEKDKRWDKDREDVVVGSVFEFVGEGGVGGWEI